MNKRKIYFQVFDIVLYLGYYLQWYLGNTKIYNVGLSKNLKFDNSG